MVTLILNSKNLRQGFIFPKSIRLLKQFEFDLVHNSNSFAADDTLVIKAMANRVEITRLGLSVSRKVGNAVVRNKWKRCIREAFRQKYMQLPNGLDLVVRPRKGAACRYKEIERSLVALARKINCRMNKNVP